MTATCLELTRLRHRSCGAFFGAVFLAMLSFAVPWREAAAQGPAGTVARVQGAALAMRDATPRKLDPGGAVFIGDVISTGADARIEITMIDGGVVTLGERTVFVVIDYAFTGADGNAVLRLMQGAALAVTGRIAALGENRVRMETEVATIGIRGTTVWGGILDGAWQFIMLEGRAVTVENRHGRAVLDQPGLGTQIPTPDSAPTTSRTWPADKTERTKRTVTFN